MRAFVPTQAGNLKSATACDKPALLQMTNQISPAALVKQHPLPFLFDAGK